MYSASLPSVHLGSISQCSLSLGSTVALSQPQALRTRPSASVTSSARIMLHSFRAMMECVKSSRTDYINIQPQPLILIGVRHNRQAQRPRAAGLHCRCHREDRWRLAGRSLGRAHAPELDGRSASGRPSRRNRAARATLTKHQRLTRMVSRPAIAVCDIPQRGVICAS